MFLFFWFFLISLFFLRNYISFSFLLMWFLFIYFINFSDSLLILRPLYYNNVILDEVSFYISFMTLFCFFIRSNAILNMISCFSGVLSLSLLIFSCLVVFNTYNFLCLFIFFEFSIFPISYIILKWGLYPDRSKGVIIMLCYTLFFSLPFLVLLISNYISV